MISDVLVDNEMYVVTTQSFGDAHKVVLRICIHREVCVHVCAFSIVLYFENKRQTSLVDELLRLTYIHDYRQSILIFMGQRFSK